MTFTPSAHAITPATRYACNITQTLGIVFINLSDNRVINKYVHPTENEKEGRFDQFQIDK
jgi:hypothetical protein